MIEMMKKVALGTGLSLAMAVGVLSTSVNAADMAADAVPPGVTAYATGAEFEDVRFNLETAIVNRGLVIDYVSHIGDMLARTKEDVGGTKDLYANAVSMLFCSANLSRKMMEADPGNIAYCPYAVFAYEKAEDPGSVLVGFRRLDETGSDASKAAIAEINTLLDDIVKEAAGE
ncbi:DUF302 domain-containing protein [Roseibium sp.]|uniref:DUF302 domain-containing protein n=1 Tax=Roseibium sp. TaxID=1936156 RepID=UPI003A97AB3C